jgi:hypothetical protein
MLALSQTCAVWPRVALATARGACALALKACLGRPQQAAQRTAGAVVAAVLHACTTLLATCKPGQPPAPHLFALLTVLLSPACSALPSAASAAVSACSLQALLPGLSTTTSVPSSSLGRALKRERLGVHSKLGGCRLGVRASDNCGDCACCWCDLHKGRGRDVQWSVRPVLVPLGTLVSKTNSLPPVNWRWVEEGDGYVGRLQPPGQPLGVGLPSGLQCLVPYPYR